MFLYYYDYYYYVSDDVNRWADDDGDDDRSIIYLNGFSTFESVPIKWNCTTFMSLRYFCPHQNISLRHYNGKIWLFPFCVLAFFQQADQSKRKNKWRKVAKERRKTKQSIISCHFSQFCRLMKISKSFFFKTNFIVNKYKMFSNRWKNIQWKNKIFWHLCCYTNYLLKEVNSS